MQKSQLVLFGDDIAEAANELGDGVGKILSGIGGIIFSITLKLPLMATILILQIFEGDIGNAEGTTEDAYQSDLVLLTPDDIFFNKLNITDINFFDTNTTSDTVNTIREQIALWYYIMEIIAIAILLVILIVVGIRMAITTVATEKAIYKKALVDWATSLALVFALHYIIRGVIWINDSLVSIIKSIVTANGDGMGTLMGELYLQMLKIDLIKSITAIALGFMLLGETLMFLFMYMKRMLTLAFLVIISPLITITYSIDKMGDQKAQALNNWLKEFVYNVLIQPFHCILYIVFANTALGIAVNAGNSATTGFLALLCMKFIFDGEKIIRKIFGFEQASSLKDAAVTGAVVGSALGKVAKGGIAVGAPALKFAAKNSKVAEKISDKWSKVKEKVPGLGEIASNVKEKVKDTKIGTYVSNVKDNVKDKVQSSDKLVPIRDMAKEMKKSTQKTIKAAKDTAKTVKDGIKDKTSGLREKASEAKDKIMEKKPMKKIKGAVGRAKKEWTEGGWGDAIKQDLKTYGRKLYSPEKIAKATATIAVAGMSYGLPNTDMLSSIGLGLGAGKGVEAKVSQFRNRRKEYFEDDVMEAWTRHCNNPNNNADVNDIGAFKTWYGNIVKEGKIRDAYSDANVQKAEGKAKDDLRDIHVDNPEKLIGELKRAMLNHEQIEPDKLFSGYGVDPAEIERVLSSFMNKYSESLLFNKSQLYDSQMNQFGITSENVVEDMTTDSNYFGNAKITQETEKEISNNVQEIIENTTGVDPRTLDTSDIEEKLEEELEKAVEESKDNLETQISNINPDIDIESTLLPKIEEIINNAKSERDIEENVRNAVKGLDLPDGQSRRKVNAEAITYAKNLNKYTYVTNNVEQIENIINEQKVRE